MSTTRVKMHPEARTLQQLLATQAKRHGSAPAIVALGRAPLGYAMLADHVERTCAALAGMGFGRTDRIAMALPNAPEAAVALLAAMAAGTGVPLNPALDQAALARLLIDLRVSALIAWAGDHTPAIAAARSLDLPLIRLVPHVRDAAGTFSLTSETTRHAVPLEHRDAEDVALMMHTSGSLGKPKAVPLTHGQVLVRSLAQPIDRNDRCLCVAPLFTSSALHHSLLGPLAVGASVAFADNASAEGLLAVLESLRVTYFSASPTVHATIADELARRGTKPATALRFIRSSSNVLPAALQEQLESALGVPVVQGYGMTEVGTIAQNPLPPLPCKQGSVGTSVGPKIAIVAEDGTPLGPNVTGEVIVRGPGITRGYENDPEANRMAFCDGWFRTGDLGYLDEDGYLFLTGRLKELINRGGMKVSPSEVDAVLLQHPAVREAASFAVPHPSLGEDVAAAAVLYAPGTVTSQQLRDFLLDRLAPQKVPTSITFVTELPRIAPGKISRLQLAKRVGKGTCRDFVAPCDPVERFVAEVFAEVLHVGPVGARDNFFELGGDSLRGAQAVTRINAAHGTDLSAADLFRRPTVAEFAGEVRSIVAATSRSLRALPIELAQRRKRRAALVRKRDA